MKALLSVLILLTFLVVSGSAAETAASDKAAAFKNIGIEQFEKLRSDTNNVVLDVRTKKEFDAGHIAGAVHINWYAPDFEKQVRKLDPSKTYLVHCAIGGRSAEACAAMSKLKFTNCFNLEPGFKGWEKAGKPVVK